MTGDADPEILREILAPIWDPPDNRPSLAENRAPSPDLSPWIATMVSIRAPTDPDQLVACGLCNDLVYVRYVFSGQWTAQMADGEGKFRDEALIFGQHSKFMPLTCAGDVMSAGFGLRPGAWYAMTGNSAADYVDRIIRDDVFGLMDGEFADRLNAGTRPEEWNAALEDAVRRFVERVQPDPPDPISTAFEAAAFADPMQSLHDFADAQNISLRKLERVIKRDFGVTPRAVMRRARAMDVAALLCGVDNQQDEDELMLRYFDQSHLSRDFTAFFGLTPRKFRTRPRPLLKVTLQQRRDRRIEELRRLNAA